MSEAAYIVGDVEIHDKASVWPGAVVRGDFGRIIIGHHTTLEDNCVVHGATDLVIGHGVIVGHGAVVHCRRIGNNVLIGNNATVLDGAEVADSCIISAGSLVTSNTRIPQGSFVTGSPARVKKRVSQEQIAGLKAGSLDYIKLSRKYKREGL